MRTEAWTIRAVEAGDVDELHRLMRAPDADECLAGGHQPRTSLQMSLEASLESFALELGGELAALGGVVPGPRGSILGPAEYDIPWLLTGRAVDRFPVAFVRASRVKLAELLHGHPVLLNLVDARYDAALRWSRLLGGQVQPTIPVGVGQVPFHPVVWRASWAIH